ncbi:AAA family ATPase [Paraconexibacter sp. AEG42_29]|uniref:ATP-binding protein n=1 Tax=Paraconexibacter sp. AEG42_29 TaxID=2997339 RepID=UPI00339D57D1
MTPRHCKDCGHRATARARFCEQCGAALTPTATPLRAPTALEARILDERTAIQGERKQVTVMYADIVGSMALTHALDAERWGLLLDRFLSIAAAAVHAFEGTVNQFTGDGLLAVFGAPLAQEDHARRACLAVLDLQREANRLATEVAGLDGVQFAVRCGLNSGEVVVGAIGDDVHMDFVPIGNTTALGKRIESLAPPGSTAMSAATAALVAGEFEVRPLGEFELKGVEGRQHLLELVGPGVARTRLEASAATRGLSPFVARDAEVAALRHALERALDGDGRAIGIAGEPGVGKSRLVHEFVAACEARGLAVSRTHGVGHGRFVPFLPVLALLRDVFGITEQDSPVAARERMGSRLTALDPELAIDLPLVHELLGIAGAAQPAVALDAAAHRRRLLAAATRAVVAPGDFRLIVVEDLHWFDDASDAFLEELVAAVRGTRTLLIGTYRHEYDAAWAAHGPHAELRLDRLDGAASDDLLTGLLGGDRTLEGLVPLIEAHAAGNPFFIEELVRALDEGGHLTGRRGAYRLESPLSSVVLPTTVQAGLAARIDRLPARAKRLLQTISVIGGEVPGPLLSAVSGLTAHELAETVELLTGAQWLVPGGVGGIRSHALHHPLSQEVAYRSQLSEPRARTHREVAAAIARAYPAALDERAALLAHHHEAGGDPLGAAGWHARAATWAGAASPADGLRHWRRARDLATALDPSPERSALIAEAGVGILGLAWRLGVSPEETAALHTESQAEGEQLLPGLYYAGALLHSGRERDGLEQFRKVSRQAVAAGDVGGALLASTGVAYATWVSGSLSEGVATIDRALPATGDDPLTGAGLAFTCPLAHAYGQRGLCVGYRGELEQARGDFARAVALAREYDDPEIESAAHSNLALVEAETGDTDAALRSAALGLAIAEAAGNAAHVLAGATATATALAGAGRYAAALERARSTLAAARRDRIGLYYEPLLLATIARSALALGDSAEALAAAEEAVAIAHARTFGSCALSAPIVLAQVLMATSGAEAAGRIDAVLVHALEVARSCDAHAFTPLIERERTALARWRAPDPAVTASAAYRPGSDGDDDAG